MADISKCHGNNCPIKDTCYRYTAPAHPTYQAFGAFDSLEDCDMGMMRLEGVAVKNRSVLLTKDIDGNYSERGNDIVDPDEQRQHDEHTANDLQHGDNQRGLSDG